MTDEDELFDTAPLEQTDTSIADAHLKAGRPIYYADQDLGGAIVKEMPDGTRYLVNLKWGAEPEVLDQVPCPAYG